MTATTTAARPQRTAAEQSPLTRAQFVARANDVCREDHAEMAKAVEDYRRDDDLNKSPGPPFAQETADVYLPSIQFMYDHINFGGLPQGDEGRAAKMLSTLERTFVDAMAHRFHSAAQLAARFTSFNRMARRYGLSSCVVTESFFPG
jgi:hypothetical protein